MKENGEREKRGYVERIGVEGKWREGRERLGREKGIEGKWKEERERVYKRIGVERKWREGRERVGGEDCDQRGMDRGKREESQRGLALKGNEEREGRR